MAQPLDAEVGAPLPVTNVKIENLSGAAKITYKLPDDHKLLYVKAECVINGKVTEVKSSAYTNELTIEGFGEAGEYEVKLYSVSLSESASAPLIVKVNPLAPPYEKAYQSLTLNETFGGASISFENPTEANLAIQILATDSTGNWKVAETYYTKKGKRYFLCTGF